MPDLPSRLVTAVARWPGWLLLRLIRGYQVGVSPVLPALFGPTFGCRFHPTCSHYAVEAVQTRGALVGLVLTVWRLARCTPLHPGGFDPVPRQVAGGDALPEEQVNRTTTRSRSRKPSCVRVAT